MLIVNDGVTLARALHGTTGPHVKRLLALRRSQLGDGWPDAAAFYVAEKGDTIADVETAIGFPLAIDGEPTSDWAVRHEGVTEVAFILSDDGPAHVLLVPDRPGMDTDLLAVGRRLTDEGCASDSDG